MIKFIILGLTTASIIHATPGPILSPDDFVRVTSQINQTYRPQSIADRLRQRYPTPADAKLIAEDLKRAEALAARDKIKLILTRKYSADIKVSDLVVARMDLDPTSRVIKIGGQAIDPRAKTYADFRRGLDKALRRQVSGFGWILPRAEAGVLPLMFAASIFFAYHGVMQYFTNMQRTTLRDDAERLKVPTEICNEANRKLLKDLLGQEDARLVESEEYRRREARENCAILIAEYEVRTDNRDSTAELILRCDAIQKAIRCAWPELAPAAPTTGASPASAH